ncbi:MAG: uroporphyrinogen decarboxylase [Parasporobacterium sp.]|nr:uroporphyrinogen decarboxylase [Parasporobacterium sp.]
MLTVKENLAEVMKKDGHPDRFVKGWEFVNCVFPTSYYMGDYPLPGHPGNGYDMYGVYWSLPEGQMGAFPVHDDEHRLVKDITEWQSVVKRPFVIEDPGYWGFLNSFRQYTNTENQYLAALHPQGLFERLHALMGMEDCLCNFYEEPDEMKALIEFITDVDLEFAKVMIERLGIEAVVSHDDWGSTKNSFLSPEMFDEFLLPAYKKIYGYYKDNGILIIHHNDGYAANLIPEMIEMGIDIWQGVIPENDLEKCLKAADGKLTLMGEIETRKLDIPGWTPEMVAEEVERACRKGTKNNFIPALTAGTPGSAFGVHEQVDKEIDRMSSILF